MWTRKDRFFMHSQDEGLCLGAGEHYGLFIHNDLTKGYSFPSETYNNDFLTDMKDFEIDTLEVHF